MMKVIGLTGGVGSGKTEVIEYLKQKYGATVVKTDELARSLQKKGGLCYDSIVSEFGEGILNNKSEIDREILGKIVFEDSGKLEVLNGIVHPHVLEEVKRKIKKEKKRNTNLFIMESAIIIGSLFEELCDELWYVYTQDSVRRKRLCYLRGYDDEKVDDIIKAQASKEDFLKNCHRVIDNSGFFVETILQIDKIVKDM